MPVHLGKDRYSGEEPTPRCLLLGQQMESIICSSKREDKKFFLSKSLDREILESSVIMCMYLFSKQEPVESSVILMLKRK